MIVKLVCSKKQTILFRRVPRFNIGSSAYCSEKVSFPEKLELSFLPYIFKSQNKIIVLKKISKNS